MPVLRDGPASEQFTPIILEGNCEFDALARMGLSREIAKAARYAHEGQCIAWGIPFDIRKPVVLRDESIEVEIKPTRARWFIFIHTADIRADHRDKQDFTSSVHDPGELGQCAANYILIYDDGSVEKTRILYRHHIGSFHSRWGEFCVCAVPAMKPKPVRDIAQQPAARSDPVRARQPDSWGVRQTLVAIEDGGPWNNYLWALENRFPTKPIKAVRFEPLGGSLIVSGIAAGEATSMPLRWQSRRKAILTMPEGAEFDPFLDEFGQFKQIQLDLGQVISVEPRLLYPKDEWSETRQNLQPGRAPNQMIVEYSAHPDAVFHLSGGERIAVADLVPLSSEKGAPLCALPAAKKRITIRVIDELTGQIVPVKLHVHGPFGEYLAPTDHHRIPNRRWYEGFGGSDLIHGDHVCAYISGETIVEVPLAKIYVEVTKGFEIQPLRQMFTVIDTTDVITIVLKKRLKWREKGWVTADTHVHFLSPTTAMLEGAAEGVNVINLLASQWGEMMTNVGDFDGRSTYGSKKAGGDGEYLVRVGTENRQRVLGHISLLGYSGNIITPLCAGGPNESAIGAPVDVLVTEWAQRCREQGGIVVLPHFPDPRLENAATYVLNKADAVEMCSLSDFYSGIDPYSLFNWYRYLNNGYITAAVGGTDKMSAEFAVGTVRTYAHIRLEQEFCYESWMDAISSARTFVTYGPLMEFSVGGREMGSELHVAASGATVDVSWEVASVIVPMTEVQLIVNGMVRESRRVKQDKDEGSWSILIDRSSWLALLVRAKYADKPEMIAAHSSPVVVSVDGSELFAAADALTILNQIEGAMAYVDTIGTRAETTRYRKMKVLLESAYRRIHNRMHDLGMDHYHDPAASHDRNKR